MDAVAKATSVTPPIATVKEVAQRARVSTATVSRVLSGSAGVREPLRSRVLDAARVLSYRPNRAARDLRVRSSRTIGVLIADIENPFQTSVVFGIENVVKETSYSLILASYDEDPAQEARRLQTFRAEGVCGLIFVASREPSPLYTEMRKSGVALVAVSRAVSRLRVDEVTVSNRDGAYSATSHLIQLGHKRIAFINGPLVLTTARDRQLGYEDAFHDAGLPIDPRLVVHCDFKHAAGHLAMRQLLDLDSPPTAVFGGSNLVTLGALQAIHERRLEVPDQIAIVGFDEMPWAVSLRPPLTTVGQPAFEVGRTAAELLLDRIRRPVAPRRQVVLETRLIVRSSCGFNAATRLPVSVC